MEKKILVAIGNTGLDKITINYLVSQFQGRVDVCFHLFSLVQVQGVSDSQRLLADIESVANTNVTAQKKRIAARNNLNQLQRMFVDAGFAESHISCETCFTWEGISSALLRKGKGGMYDAIALGKRDMSGLQKMISGSISSGLWENDHTIPLWIINGTPASRNFLVPVDCAMHTLRAVDHLGFILQNDEQVQINLFHASSLLAAEHISPIEDFHEKWGKEWCDKYLQGDAEGHFHFEAAEQILQENNIPAQHIHRLQVKSGIEPAQMIVSEVKKHPYSTIVMGRRLDKEKNIFKGVSDRVLANVENMALWVVG